MVELGGFVEEAGHGSHSTDNLTNSHITELGVSMLFLEEVEYLLLLLNGVFNLLLEGSREVSLTVLYINELLSISASQ